MTQNPSQQHESAVDALAVRTKGFSRVLLKACGIRMSKASRMLPDAFTVSTTNKRITIYEVIVTHPLYPAKLDKCRALRDEMRAVGWALRLRVAGSTRISMETEKPIDVDLDSENPWNDIDNERIRRVSATLYTCAGKVCR